MIDSLRSLQVNHTMFRHFFTLIFFFVVISAGSIANADLVFTITEETDSGGFTFVRTTVSGSINLDATQGFLNSSSVPTAFIDPADGMLGVGVAGSFSLFGLDVDEFTPFGLDNSVAPTGSGSGDVAALFPAIPSASVPAALALPSNYVSETELSGTAEFVSATFDNLFLTPGTFVTEISNTANGVTVSDTITVIVVPEPSSILICLGSIGVFALRRRR